MGSAAVLWVMLWSTWRGDAASEGAGSPAPSVAVRVWNAAGLPQDQLERSRRVVEDALGSAGVRVSWVTCGPGACSSTERPGEIGLRIARLLPDERRSAGEATFGAALVIDRQRGQGIVYVFVDSVRELASAARLPDHVVLGITAAHEIAHVLLPPGHSDQGIMKARMSRQDWMAAAKGWLSFSADDRARLRRRAAQLGRPAGTSTTAAWHPTGWSTHIY